MRHVREASVAVRRVFGSRYEKIWNVSSGGSFRTKSMRSSGSILSTMLASIRTDRDESKLYASSKDEVVTLVSRWIRQRWLGLEILGCEKKAWGEVLTSSISLTLGACPVWK